MTKEIIVLSFLKTSGLLIREGQELEVMSMTFLFAHILAHPPTHPHGVIKIISEFVN